MFLALTANAQAYFVIADVHAGKEKVRKGMHGRPNDYPRQGVKNWESALKQAVKRGEKVVFSLGDETNRRETKYEKKLLKVAKKYPQLTILYTRGNHNPNNSVLTPTPYYFQDIDGKRIVVLNTNEAVDTTAGGISQTQLDWLKEVIKDRQVIVLTHHPLFQIRTCDVLPQFQALKEILDSQNIEQVLSGHWHLRQDCGKYHIFPALTAKGWSIL
jgi:calcineurin-like phosphoesterase family protein